MIGRSDLPPPPEAPRRSTPFWKRWWFWAIVVVAILIAAAAGLDPGEGDEGASTPTRPTVTTPTEPIPPTPPPQPVLVPDVVGLSTAGARNALQDQALTVSSVEKRYSNEAKGTVLKQTPRSSLEVPEGTAVELIVAQPFPKVPDVTSKNLTQAKRILRKAGFAVVVRKQNSTTKRHGDIISQNPPGGTEVRPGRTVTLVVIDNT